MSQMQWFRLYHRMVDDEKLRLLAFEDRWHFVALCCLKSSGLLDEPDSDIRNRKIAVKLGIQVRELEEVARRLREVDLIDDGLIPNAWDDLQYRSDNSTDRVQKFREKQRGNKSKRDGNVSASTQETDTETEEIEAKASRASSDAPSLKPKHVFDEWNAVAVRIGKRTVRDLTPARTELCRCRIAQYSIEDFVAVFGKVEASRFLREGRFCTFDWTMKRANFQKIIEGNYDD